MKNTNNYSQEITKRSTCRVCNSNKIVDLYSLGDQYINNFIEKKDLDKCLKAPLDMILCENCSLLQLKHTAPQELLYSGYYWYKSSVTNTMKNALQEIAQTIEKKFDLESGDVVLDIGSNDGTLLRSYKIKNLIKVGVEPAKNLYEEGKVGLDHFINDFWNYDSYKKNISKKAKIITAIGMFYDMEDPNQFIKDAANALQDEGVFIAQLMCLKNMIDSNDVGNICHEHLEFYSYKSLKYLFEQNGLEIFDIEKNFINGGSYRIYAKKTSSNISSEFGKVRILKIEQEEKNLSNINTHISFFNKIEKNKKLCVEFIEKVIKEGKKVWVYGASTKGNVILQYYGLDSNLIEAAAERSPWKWGKYTVGSMIPCVSEEEARKANPDYFLVLPYAFINEFCLREKTWLNNGGKFIVPLPEFRIIQ